MKRFRKLLSTITAATILATGLSAASAQGVVQSNTPRVNTQTAFTQYYVISDLMSRPGQITLGKSGMVFIDFPENVTAVITPDGAKMDIPEPLGNLVIMTAKVSTGTAQVLIQLENGEYAAWNINFTGGTTPMKRIKVERAPTVDLTPPSSTPATLPPSGGMPVYTPPSLNTPLTTSTKPINRDQPTWLSMSSSVRRATSGNTITLSITNNGTRAVTFNPTDLSVSIGGRAITLDSQKTLTVGAGTTETYTLALPSTIDTTQAKVEWLAYDAASNTYYRISSSNE